MNVVGNSKIGEEVPIATDTRVTDNTSADFGARLFSVPDLRGPAAGRSRPTRVASRQNVTYRTSLKPSLFCLSARSPRPSNAGADLALPAKPSIKETDTNPTCSEPRTKVAHFNNAKTPFHMRSIQLELDVEDKPMDLPHLECSSMRGSSGQSAFHFSARPMWTHRPSSSCSASCI